MDEGSVSWRHASNLHAARTGVVKAVGQDGRREDFPPHLEDSFTGDEGEGISSGHGGDGGWREGEVIHAEGGGGRGVGQIFLGVEF